MFHEGDLKKDKAEKLTCVIEKLTPYCTEDSKHDKFRCIARCLMDGKKLIGENLEGSTNFSYRVYPDGHRHLSVFAKIGFDYARWNPDKSFYDLNRISIEYEMLKKFHKLTAPSSPVAKPYLCIDVCPKTKMIVSEWAPSHAVWVEQFIRGQIDARVTKKLARFIATVNTQPIDDLHLNNGIKDSFRGLYPMIRSMFAEWISSTENPPADHFIAYSKELGQQRFDEIIDSLAAAYNRSDVLLHGDTHAMNVLVEPSTIDGSFGEKGEYYVCDWEMVHVGDKGRDPGTFYAFPVLCSYFLAARGETKMAFDIIASMNQFWLEYSEALIEQESYYKDDIATVFRSTLGWFGVYSFIANYCVGVQRAYMPFDLVSKEASDACMASLALTGVKCLEKGFLGTDSESTMDQLWNWYEGLIKEQINVIIALCL